ncbi:MAG TPA: histidine--tRNA ligase [Kouleothrix sp.]|uniref:histidine--tRNA ligase n=1 Tax=Kouleothrix sp. TaxID=2779161 RepID=UPI002C307ABE|nr:histidine--tRNA ligase [Kouleothrix sp.]HRC74182.1 histidine--tRNA ligase [Kouleothrix sp.]
MSNKPQNFKGMRDHLPAAMILRQHILNTLVGVFERHGFEPLQTPIIEYARTLEGKIGDEEKLIYHFETAGGDKVALRYDQTVPLARVVAQYQGQLVFPWRRYAIGQSYRGERQQRGRYREFWQADVDIVGSASPIADAEIIAVLTEALRALGFSGFTTQLNHRQVLAGVARASGLDEASAGGVYRAIDKLDKIGADGVREELLKSGVAAEAAGRILDMVLLQGPPSDVLEELSDRLAGDERAEAALENLRAILAYLPELGVPPETYAVSPQLARGLSYYTGVVFESVLASPPMGSLLGGGRYDELVGAFAGRPIPTVGLAFGIERLHDVMEELGMGPARRTVAEVFVTLFDRERALASLQLASELRAAGLKVETALDANDKLGKQFKYADQRGIGFALVLGPDEIARGEVVVKNLRSGEQRAVARADVVAALRTSE